METLSDPGSEDTGNLCVDTRNLCVDTRLVLISARCPRTCNLFVHSLIIRILHNSYFLLRAKDFN